MRVTFGGEDLEHFEPMGYDQWFRLFLPVASTEALGRVPQKANTMLGYLKYLRIPGSERPVMREYTVRQYRPGGTSGPELDVDFVLHGDEGVASRWVAGAAPGDPVLIIDEGTVFSGAGTTEPLLLASDETGVPAVAGICTGLSEDARGLALIEVATPEDELAFAHPAGIEVRWLIRESGQPGSALLPNVRDRAATLGLGHAFVVGESGMVTSIRRHLVEIGVPKQQIDFVGYWRLGRARA